MQIRSGIAFALLAGTSLLIAPAFLAAAPMTIVRDGASNATIVVAADALEEDIEPSPWSRTPGQKIAAAAQELQIYIEKICGAKLPVVSDAQNVAGNLIIVGPSRYTDRMGAEIPSGLTPARRDEGFTIACRGDRLVLAGNDAGPYHGTEYAVYDFLERLGVRWFMPGEYGEIVPERTTIDFPEMQVIEKPDFAMRSWGGHWDPPLVDPYLGAEESRWKLRSKMTTVSFGGAGDGTVSNIAPGPEYREVHPEYFAKDVNGNPDFSLPSFTHPKAVEIAAEAIEKHFRQRPNSHAYGFALGDGADHDFSPQTMKINQGFKVVGWPIDDVGGISVTEEWFTFVSNVAREVRKEFPDVYIGTNGYANREVPPQGVELDDHLVVMYAPIWCCTMHAFDDEHCWQKMRQAQMLKRWCELSDNVWVYGYPYNMLVSGLTPLPEITKLRRDFPLMKKWGVVGFRDETRSVLAECGIFSRYLRAKLEWNADADVDAMMDDFFGKWYGKAAAPMKAYELALDAAFVNTPMHGHEDRVLHGIYTPQLMSTLAAHLDEAERLADTERTRLHVRADRLIYEHLGEYIAVRASEAAGDFAGVARHAQNMLDIRPHLFAINPWYMWKDESAPSGVWYWRMTDRRDFYQALANKTSGKAGDLVALLPETAMFRTDPHDDGRFEPWYEPDLKETDWETILTTKPFYSQGHQDEKGHIYVGHIWYRFDVDVPAMAEHRKVVLYAPVVEGAAWCWVNGEYVGRRPHQSPYIRPAQMEMDVTTAIRSGARNQITIRVHTSLSPAEVAGGLVSRLFLYSPGPQAVER